MDRLIHSLESYEPCCEQEERDKRVMLDFLRTGETPLLRGNEVAHFTASAWIVNRSRTRVLMAWHNIYRSWSWTGGHADGEADLLAVAMREAREETGVQTIAPVDERIFSVETLNVNGHEKRGRYVPCHLHMNVTYLLEADENEPLRVKPDENSGVRWMTPEELADSVSEKWMLERVYGKLCRKVTARAGQAGEK